MKISVVSTLYYSQSYIYEFYQRTVQTLKKITADYEIVFVNDGSPDDSLANALQIQQSDNNVVVVDLSRNFGHHKAMMTGLKFCSGDYVFLIDTDLEEDPELLENLWNEIEKDAFLDVVYGVQIKRKGSWFERVTGRVYYIIFSFLTEMEYPSDSLTARLMSKIYVQNLLEYKEKEIDIWGLFVLNGFKQKEIKVTKKYKGSTTYTFRKKIKHAIDSITSLSSRPLYYIFVLGSIITFSSLLGLLYILRQKFKYGVEVEGWASILFSIWFIGGVIMFTLGIIGIYLSKIFLEVKNRPLTVIRNVYK